MTRESRRRRSPRNAERQKEGTLQSDAVTKNGSTDATQNNGDEGGNSTTRAAVKPGGGRNHHQRRREPVKIAALDLGTNNCRLLIATPRGRKFRVIDAFSRIIRLGNGLSRTGALSDAAMDRCIDALKVCAEKINRREVTKVRCIATQACRAASNGEAFLARVKEETGLEFDIISTEEEARLAAAGCADLIDQTAKACLIFDIGGGSTEVSLVRINQGIKKSPHPPKPDIIGWFSMPLGVVNLAERYGGETISKDGYWKIVDDIRDEIRKSGDPGEFKSVFKDGEGHFLGTSGTVTSLAGVHLNLPRYRRDAVDGIWLSTDDARAVTDKLRHQTNEERAQEPCIGEERSDLVVCGCAILEALLQDCLLYTSPSPRDLSTSRMPSSA